MNCIYFYVSSVTNDIPVGHQLVKFNAAEKKRQRWMTMLDPEQAQIFSREPMKHVTRLECVISAIEIQLEELYKQHPNKRVVLITFNNEVNVYGDGTSTSQWTINGNTLNDVEKLLKFGQDFNIAKVKPIAESKGFLLSKLLDMDENGQTALGPALACGIAIASKQSGSNVILCTDGLSNIGVGQLEHVLDPSAFYNHMSGFAKQHGVMVSVIGIEGGISGLETLGPLAQETSGSVHMVKALELQRKMRQILDNPIVATHVQLKLLVHPSMSFAKKKPEQAVDEKKKQDTKKKQQASIADAIQEQQCQLHYQCMYQMGNVNLQMEWTSHYTQHDTDATTALPSSIPIQAQIAYTKQDGSQYIRVMNRQLLVTTDRDTAEKEANVAVVGLHAIQQSAAVAHETGDVEQARLQLMAAQRLAERVAKNSTEQTEEYCNFVQQTADLDEQLMNAKQDDQYNAVIFASKQMNSVSMWSAEKKKEVVQKRKNHTPAMTKKPKATPVPLLVAAPEPAPVVDLLLEEKQKLEAELKAKEESKMCVICEAHEINIVLIPCGHLVMCSDCLPLLDKKLCPYCRQEFSQAVKTYGR